MTNVGGIRRLSVFSIGGKLAHNQACTVKKLIFSSQIYVFLGEICRDFFYSLKVITVLHMQVWLAAAKGKGLEISGTFSRKSGQVLMELTLTNRALQAMSGFAIQFNKNRFQHVDQC
jgi:hypothetical protein